MATPKFWCRKHEKKKNILHISTDPSFPYGGMDELLRDKTLVNTVEEEILGEYGSSKEFPRGYLAAKERLEVYGRISRRMSFITNPKTL